jgi:HK97 family phage prohead protease
MGSFVEVIKRGAFKRTLAESPDVVLLINHGGLPIARTKSGTLRLAENERGLAVEAELDPDDDDVAQVARKLVRGDLDGSMSMAFRCTDQRWSDAYDYREITAVSLHSGDVSLVTNPANDAAVGATISERGASTLAARRRRAEALGKRCGGLVEFRGTLSLVDTHGNVGRSYTIEPRAHILGSPRTNVAAQRQREAERLALIAANGGNRKATAPKSATAIQRERERQRLARLKGTRPR